MCGFPDELSQLLCGSEVEGLLVGWERTGALMLEDPESPVFYFASPDWEGVAGTIAFEVEYEGYCEGWTVDVTWPNDLDVCAELWRCNVRAQLPELRAAAERLEARFRKEDAKRREAEAARRAEPQRCPMCNARVRICANHEPGCVHCLRCWWCGHESDTVTLGGRPRAHA
jgi:hypothetical protein